MAKRHGYVIDTSLLADDETPDNKQEVEEPTEASPDEDNLEQEPESPKPASKDKKENKPSSKNASPEKESDSEEKFKPQVKKVQKTNIGKVPLRMPRH